MIDPKARLRRILSIWGEGRGPSHTLDCPGQMKESRV